ncbi:hypothetical protein CDAR_40241 [Caerostris darwini]|uniref:Uncharacterized protein n=1 Tax=Caerostris darwini TaxID=1538125 RepID=A0AAV4R9W5_9ARAC|nr:hypothetical protein CDAR_40241 [Caerostris darwini]
MWHTCSVYNISKACFQLKFLENYTTKRRTRNSHCRAKRVFHQSHRLEEGYLCKSSNLRNKRTSWCLIAAAFKCADETYKWFAAAAARLVKQTSSRSAQDLSLVGGCPPRDSGKG